MKDSWPNIQRINILDFSFDTVSTNFKLSKFNILMCIFLFSLSKEIHKISHNLADIKILSIQIINSKCDIQNL